MDPHRVDAAPPTSLSRAQAPGRNTSWRGRVWRTVRLGIVALGLATAACTSTSYRAAFQPPSGARMLDQRAAFLKCHTKDGSVVVLQQWELDLEAQVVRGDGLHYDSARKLVSKGQQEVQLAQIQLLETNEPRRVLHASVPVMAVATGASLLVTAACAANAKACFGSCPTFYVEGNGGPMLQAEGFSASVLPSLEATDVDALWMAVPQSRMDLVMRNEALETHAIDSVSLLAVPRRPGERVLRTGESYHISKRLSPPERCSATHGDCLIEVTATDEREYRSPANSKDLATKETVDLRFPRAPGRLGIFIVARNSLLNTYLFYQGLAYMGRSAGEWYVRLDHAPPERRDFLSTFAALLGDIEVSVRAGDGAYHAIGRHSEMGPIAREGQLVVIPDTLASEPDTPLDVRLTMTAGNFKLDQVALAELGEQVHPTALRPVAVYRNDRPDPRAQALLSERGDHLFTYPGDAYTLRFALPDTEVELFLESRGYYYEWVREQWLTEESPRELARLLLDPRGALRRLAPRYKRLEGHMESIFWQSKVGHP